MIRFDQPTGWWASLFALALTLFLLGFTVGLWAALWSLPALETLIAALITAGCALWAVGRPLPGRLARIDHRVAAILIATFLSVAATLVGFAIGLQGFKDLFIKDVFAGWVGSVAFFGVVGAVTAVASLASPAEEPYDSRARILVRGKSGEHVDHFIGNLKESLAHYAETVDRVLTIHEYEANMYRVQVCVTTRVCSFVDDVETIHTSKVSYKPDAPPPQGKFHRLTRLSGVLDEAKFTAHQQNTATLIERPFTANLRREKPCQVAFELDIWSLESTEVLSYRPLRFTNQVTMDIQNRLDRPLHLRLAWNGGAETPITLRPGENHPTLIATNVHPNHLVHRVFLDRITDQG